MMFEHHTLLLIALLPCNDMLSKEAAFLEIRLFQILFCKWFNQVILFEVEKSVDLWNKQISNYIYINLHLVTFQVDLVGLI